MWPSRHSLRGQRNQGRGGEGPELPHFFSLPGLPCPNVFCESLFFRVKMASAVKHSRMVVLSAERVLESLEQKDDDMSSGEESDLYRQLQHTRNRLRYTFLRDCVITQAHTDDAFQIILLSSSGHSIYNSVRTYFPRIYQL